MGSGVNGVPCACSRCGASFGRYSANHEPPESGYMTFLDYVGGERARPIRGGPREHEVRPGARKGARTGTGIYLEEHEGAHYVRVICNSCRAQFGTTRNDKMLVGKVRVKVVKGVYYV